MGPESGATGCLPAATVETATIILNGAPYALGNTRTIAALLTGLCARGRIAVDVNGCIVPRSHHAGYALQPGDQVEVVQAVGGG